MYILFKDNKIKWSEVKYYYNDDNDDNTKNNTKNNNTNNNTNNNKTTIKQQ